MPIQRYKLTIAYRGTNYHGWQEQTANSLYKGPVKRGQSLPTIQHVLARAMARVVQHPVTISGSSRTDAGVHAKGQVAHFESDKPQIPIAGMRLAVNHALPDDILVRKIEPVPATFDSITWTRRKRYQYSIWNGLDRPVFAADMSWHRWKPLDVGAMRAAAAHFIGEHDFRSFSRPKHGRLDTVRTIFDCSVSARGEQIVIGVEGNGFLWNMIRIMVGTIVEIGHGYRGADDVRAMLEARDRRAAGATAPPHGLFLQWIQTHDWREGKRSANEHDDARTASMMEDEADRFADESA